MLKVFAPILVLVGLIFVSIAGAASVVGSNGNDWMCPYEFGSCFTGWSDGNDVVDAKAGGDLVSTYNGEDIAYGGAGSDQVFGGPAHDVLYARGGSSASAASSSDVDRLYGDGGNDTLAAANTQADRLDCGAGYDIVYYDQRDTVISGTCEEFHFQVMSAPAN